MQFQTGPCSWLDIGWGISLYVVSNAYSTYTELYQLRTLGTRFHQTLDPVILWTPSNDTSRPICSDSLSLMPPVPQHLRTLSCYTNVVIIIINIFYYYFYKCPQV